MSPPLGERKRAKKPKVRTGCVTCKSKRVKCDEGKPACARCIRLRIDCGGYRDPYVVAEEKKEGHHQFKLMPRVHNPKLLNPLSTIVAFSSPFYDPGQNRYYLYFQEQTISHLSGPFDEGLFSQVALQACYSEPALMRLIVAIGAMDKSSRRFHCNSISASEASMHRQQALLSYGQALYGVQKLASIPTAHTPRLFLLAALLIFCFENLNGDVTTARRNMMSALHLMHKQLAQKTYTYRHTSKVPTSPDLEDSIIAAFARIDNGLISRPDLILEGTSRNEYPTHNIIASILKINYTPGNTLPSEFESIHEARTHLETVQFHSLPLLTKDFHARANRSAAQTPCQETTAVYERAIKDFQRWDEAFKPLYAKSIFPTAAGLPNPNFMGVEILRARGMATVLAFQSLFLILQEKLEIDTCSIRADLTYNCLEIIQLSERISAEPSFRRDFVLDCGIVPGLFMAIIAPVDVSINRMALEAMRGIVPRTEGTWNSTALVKVGEAFLEKL